MNTKVMTTRKIAVPGRGAESRTLVVGAGATAKAPARVTPERIQARAYEIFLARNGGGGDALTDWLQAEGEMRGSGPLGDTAGC